MRGTSGDAHTISSEFVLCSSCLGRVASRGGRALTRSRDGVTETECFVCRGLMNGLDALATVILERASEYDYDTFAVGATIKPSILDCDDYIRSRAGAVGAASIKTALTGKLACIISRYTKKVVNHTCPDITILVDTRFGSCEIHSRHAVVRMRYTKSRRGIPQKRIWCDLCGGGGCRNCMFKGTSPSIEDILEEYLLEMMGGTDVRFTWVGGEDRNSLVLGAGRPVYARVRNPVRSAAVLPERVSLDGVDISEIHPVGCVPRRLPSFRSVVRVLVRCKGITGLKRLRALAGEVVVHNSAGRPSTKMVGPVRYRRLADDSFRMETEVEGGMPVKRLVSGDGVDPSTSSVLGAQCACTRFDFLDIITNS